MTRIVSKTKKTKIEEVSISFVDAYSNKQPGTTRTRGRDGYDYVRVTLPATAGGERAESKIRKAELEKILAARIAVGYEARISGMGSYRKVIVYRIEQVEGRAQMRGICQGCGGSVAVDGETTSLHGYERPGDGYVVGRCHGARRPAANFDLTLAKSLIAAMQKLAADCRAMAEKDKQEIAALQAALPEYHEETTRELWRTERQKISEREGLMRDRLYMARTNETFAKHLTDVAIPAFGTALVEVIL